MHIFRQHTSMPQKKFYILPASVVYAATIALFTSLLLNLIGILAALKDDPNFGMASKEYIKPRAVALEVVDSDRYGLKDDNDWASVTPLGHGFVKIDDEFYALSMYHQMHCLNSFRRMFKGHHNASREEHDGLHVMHCLSYLRQMVLCGADVTLEPAFSATNTDGRQTRAAYGTGVTHKCHDWVEVRRFAESNYESWKDEASGFVATEISTVNA